MKKIILAEDHKVVRDGLKMLLESTHEYQIIREANNGQEVLEAIGQGYLPDLVISDINMPNMDGITMLKLLKENYPKIPVLIISMLDGNNDLFEVIHAGAHGYLTKCVDTEELFFAISKVLSGERYICSRLAIRILDEAISNNVKTPITMDGMLFSSREIEILQLIGQGLTNVEMADRLFISKRTVEGHRQNLIDKTGARNTAVLLKLAFSNGLIN